MNRITTFAILTVGISLLGACGGPAPEVEPTAVPAQPTEMAMPTAPDPTQPAPAEPAPTTEPETSAIRVEINLADNTINSSVTSFKIGVPYTFVINNRGRHEHNFNVAPPVALAISSLLANPTVLSAW